MIRKIYIFCILTLLFSVNGFAQKTLEELKRNGDTDTTRRLLQSWVINEHADTTRTPIDTSWYSRHLFNPNPGNIYLSSYGTPILFNDFTKRSEPEFLFFRHYNYYRHKPEQTQYYRSTTPFTYIEFNSGGNDDAEAGLDLFHTQNINQDWNVGIDANIISSLKFYEVDRSLRSHYITLFSSYEDTNYRLYVSLNSNKIDHKEIGGVENVKQISTAGFLNDASTLIKSKEVTTKHLYYLTSFEESGQKIKPDSTQKYNSEDQDSVKNQRQQQDLTSDSTLSVIPDIPSNGLGLMYDLSFHTYQHEYADADPQSDFYNAYPIFIDSSRSRDNSTQQVFSNQLSLFFKSKFLNLDAGLEHNFQKFGYIPPFTPEDSVYEVKETTFQNLRLRGGMKLHLNNRFVFQGSFDSWFFGYRKGDINFDLQIQQKFKNSIVELSGSYYLEEPNFFMNEYNSNHFRWNNGFDKTNTVSLDLTYKNEKYDLELGISPRMIKQHVYLDTTPKPLQYGSWLQYLGVSLNKTFHIWKLHLKNNIQFQYADNEDILRFPSWSVYQSLAFRHTFHFGLTDGDLSVQLGAGYHYFSGYHANAYMPALSLFYHQDKELIGDRPLVHVFANIKLKRTSFYLKVFHVNSTMHENEYYAAPNYPIPDLMTKLGILWTFYD